MNYPWPYVLFRCLVVAGLAGMSAGATALDLDLCMSITYNFSDLCLLLDRKDTLQYMLLVLGEDFRGDFIAQDGLQMQI